MNPPRGCLPAVVSLLCLSMLPLSAAAQTGLFDAPRDFTVGTSPFSVAQRLAQRMTNEDVIDMVAIGVSAACEMLSIEASQFAATVSAESFGMAKESWSSAFLNDMD